MGKFHSTATRDDLNLVKVNTTTLKDRLNRLYDSRRNNSNPLSNEGLFEYLWDLKELALMEGRSDVEVPGTWLEELEESMTVSLH